MLKRRVGAALGLVIAAGFLPHIVFAGIEVKGGGALRLRHEYWRDLGDLNNDVLDNRNYFRIRPSLWGEADFDKNTRLYVKLTDEFKAYAYYAPSSSKSSGERPL